jgi:carbonic anhydrase/acetyltransferase-like protein (isoleucine patch superfamily)
VPVSIFHSEAGTPAVVLQVSVMHGSVIRGDLNNIKIGYFSTIQENCVIHAARSDLDQACCDVRGCCL